MFGIGFMAGMTVGVIAGVFIMCTLFLSKIDK